MTHRVLAQVLSATVAAFTATSVAAAASLGYAQINWTSDVPGLAVHTDANLKNPWGVSFNAGSPFWVSDQITGLATLYNATGVPQALVVATPPGNPTGQAFVGGMGFTTLAGASPSFVFSTLNGTIDAWNAGASAAVEYSAPDGAVYTGLTVGGSRLYAADNNNNKIDVFDNHFGKTTVSGSFVDPLVPSGFAAYNIQNIGGLLYVEYAQDGVVGGFIGVFDQNGNFIRNISDAHLDSPWGITLAPLGFGEFGGALLVGNEDDGLINAFNATSGAFLGTLRDKNGLPIVNPGLWALAFRTGPGFNPNALYFVAGVNDENDGLFAEIDPVPEPLTLGLVGAGLAMLARRRLRSRRDGSAEDN
jgi:uncharacterized protein (TIGR03118 family)